MTSVVLRGTADAWTAHSSSPSVGNLELVFRATRRTLMGTTVTGTISGSAVDVTDAVHEASGVRVMFGDEGHVEGTATLGAPYVFGHIRGTITFADEENARGRCSAVLWSLQPITSCRTCP